MSQKPERGRWVFDEKSGDVIRAEDAKKPEVVKKDLPEIKIVPRGRFIEGNVVPFEERKKALEEKKRRKGVLDPSEEDELRDLIFRTEGPLMERK